MSVILRVRKEVMEGTDNWNVGALSVPRATFAQNVLLTQSDVSGLITLNIYPPDSSTAVYTTTFAKTLTQAGGTEAIHTALVDSRWNGKNTIGHNFVHYVQQADVGAGILKGGRSYTMEYAIPTAQDGTLYAVFVWDIDARH